MDKRNTEPRDAFMDHVADLVNYWSAVDDSEDNKLIGLAHSILVTLDGRTVGLPHYDLIPMPVWSTEPDRRSIAGGLHDELPAALERQS